MNIEEIEVTILPNGQVQVNVHGVKGAACLDITRALEEALGGDLEREMTAESFEQPNANPLSDSPLTIQQRD